MKNYLDYKPEDFATDESFLKWILDEDQDEKIFWEGWLMIYPQKIKDVESAKRIIKSFHFQKYEPSNDSQEKSWNIILEKWSKEVKNTKYKENNTTRNFLKIAASISLMLVSTFLIYLSYSFNSEKIATAYGETKKVMLTDGSEVTLNGNSTIEYKQWKPGEAREVWLSGEAFFNVKHLNGNEKFIVHSNGVAIEVLGTSFNVNSRRSKTKVVLVSGKVKLNIEDRSTQKEVIMHPGDFVEYDESRTQLEIRKVNPGFYSSWKEHKLILDNTPVFEISQTLQDNYGLTSVFENEDLRNKRITGSMEVESIDGFLKALAFALNIQIETKGNQIIFNSKKPDYLKDSERDKSGHVK